MIEASAEATVDATPQAILVWVLDLERYRQADHKIGRVLVTPQLDNDGRGRVRYRGRLRGLPTPADWNTVRLQKWRRLDFEGEPGHWTRRVLDFHGSFECEPSDSGTRVTHVERFDFRAPFQPAAERLLGRWLQADIEQEMIRLAALVPGRV